jgi:hypothetical protein
MDTTTAADRLVAEAQEALDVINSAITALRSEKIRIGSQIKDLLAERKPLMRIVTAAQGRQTRNGDGPDTAE